MQGFVPISGKRQSWEELRKEVMFNNEFDTSNLFKCYQRVLVNIYRCATLYFRHGELRTKSTQN